MVKWGLAVSCLALVALPTVAEAGLTMIDFTATKNSQGLGGDTMEGSFSIDFTAGNIAINPVLNAATYITGGLSHGEFTTGSISEQFSGPLTVYIQAGNGPRDDQAFTITVPGSPNPEFTLGLIETNSPHDLTGIGAPTFLSRQDWSDSGITAYTSGASQQLIGQYLVQTISVVDEPGSLSVLSVALLGLAGLSLRSRKAPRALPG